MNTNCTICGGLLKYGPAPSNSPTLFMVRISCADCGRSSDYQCVKPTNPEQDTSHLETAARVLQKALDHGLSEVVITGFDMGEDEYFASSVADGGNALWHLERAKYKLLKIVDGRKGE